MDRRLLKGALVLERLGVDVAPRPRFEDMWRWFRDGILAVIWPFLGVVQWLRRCFSFLNMNLRPCGVNGVDVHSGWIWHRVWSAVELDCSGGGSDSDTVEEICFRIIPRHGEILSVLSFGFGGGFPQVEP